MDEHPDELRADFQQYYHLNIDGMGRDYTTLHAASLLTQLPEGSRVRLAYAPDAAWTSDRALLAAMVNDLNWLVWAQTKDAKHNRNKPRPIGPSARRPDERRVVGMAMAPDELLETIARIRREAQHG